MSRFLRSLCLTLLLAPAAFADRLPPMPAPTANDRVLIVSPHPDDETLCCAGYAQRALAAGAQVAIVWMTAGDAFELDALVVEHHLRLKGKGLQELGAKRLGEARAAGAKLGVAPDQLFLLGYADRSLRTLLDDHYDTPYWSAYTRSTRIPYASVFAPGSTYEGRNLERDLTAVIERVKPTVVLAAAPQDLHSDHATSGQLAAQIMARRGQPAAMRYWIVHAGHGWPSPRGVHLDLPLEPPSLAAYRDWLEFALLPAERDGKLAALREHRSQMEVMGRFLEGFVRANEIYSR